MARPVLAVAFGLVAALLALLAGNGAPGAALCRLGSRQA